MCSFSTLNQVISDYKNYVLPFADARSIAQLANGAQVVQTNAHVKTGIMAAMP